MSRVIHKFTLNFTGTTTVRLPSGWKILSAHAQRNFVCVWVEVVEGAPDPLDTRCVLFEVFATGESMPHDPLRVFLGTVLLDNGAIVLHVYYRP